MKANEFLDYSQDGQITPELFIFTEPAPAKAGDTHDVQDLKSSRKLYKSAADYADYTDYNAIK